jgi:endonuclease YncB( thermonuclease family)
MMIVATFLCLVTRVHDGDGPLWCKNGIKVRVAGVQAPDFENAEPCRRRRPAYVCSDVKAARSQHIVEKLTLNRSMTCQPVGKSYQRVVARCTLADGRSLSCAVIAAGAATRWDSYWRRYRMGGCS